VETLRPKCKTEIRTAMKRIEDSEKAMKVSCTAKDSALCPMNDPAKKRACQTEKFKKHELSASCEKAIKAYYSRKK
jgi:hypothetical protein